MTVSINITGLKNAQRYLNNEKKDTDKAINEGLWRAADYMRGEVKLSIAGRKAEQRSVDTGLFMNTIDIEVSKFNAAIFSLLPYAKSLEYSTNIFKGPRRHFINSLNRNKQAITKIIGQAVKSSVG